MKLYSDLADWWPLFSAPGDYAEEAGIYADLLASNAPIPVHSVLELGSGGGNNASHLKRRFRLTLVDESEAMLAVSRKLNPECEHVLGDMRTVRLNRLFDAVFVHDAIEYMTTEDDLRQAMRTAFVHCKPGGVALFVPDFVTETYEPDTKWGGEDGTDRAVRYLEWCSDPDPNDSTYTVDYAIILRSANNVVTVELDRHVCGLFPKASWLRELSAAGFQPRAVRLDYSDVKPGIGFLGSRR